jgi:hypothetical protein
MADTWSQCRCDTNNEKCQQDACADYGNQYLLVNIPAPYDKWNVATRWEDKVSCIISHPLIFPTVSGILTLSSFALFLIEMQSRHPWRKSSVFPRFRWAGVVG